MSEGWGFGPEEVAGIRAKIMQDFQPGGHYYKELVKSLLRTLGADVRREVRQHIINDLSKHFRKELGDVLADKEFKKRLYEEISHMVIAKVDGMFTSSEDW